MCLFVNAAATVKLRQKLARQGFVWVYKVLHHKEGRLVSPIVELGGRQLVYRPGYTRAKGRRPTAKKAVRGGALHVYLRRVSAVNYLTSGRRGLVIVRARATAHDFLAVDNFGQAAFRGITISPDAHAKALLQGAARPG